MMLMLVKAAVMAQRARDEGLQGVIGQVLNIPVTCHPELFPKDKYKYTSFQENFNAPIIDGPKMTWFWSKPCLKLCGKVLLGLMNTPYCRSIRPRCDRRC
jgi:acetyl esterase/lipase